MRLNRLFTLLFFALSLNVFSETFAVLPVETISFRADRKTLFYSSIINNIIKKGHTVIDSVNIDKVLKQQEYNFSDLVGIKDKEIQLGNMLQAKYLLFSSFIWNGEYTLIDIHLTDISQNQIIFQKVYTTTESAESIASSGIKEIIDELFGLNTKSSFFDSAEIIDRTEKINSIIRWARNRNISAVFLVYIGGLSSFDVNSEYNKLAKPGYNKYYNSVLNYVLEEYKTLKQQGEFVKMIHLGSISDDSITDDKSLKISYDAPSILLSSSPNIGIIFYGKYSENVKIESYISKENSIRYWFKNSWDESW